MDIRALTCFIAVAEELHFRRAAQRLHMTQPSLSQRISALEREVGVDLFVRNRRGVGLTASGLAFLEPARRAVESAGIAREYALRAARGEVGRLRLGFTVIAFYGRLPEAVQAFRRRYPDVDIDLSEMNSPSLETALATGAVDLAILHPPLAHPDLVVRSLPEEPLVLALPSSHALAPLRDIPVAALAGEPMLMAPRHVGPNIHDRMIAYFRSSDVTPRIVQEVTPMTTLSGLVAAGVGIGFVTQGMSRLPRPGVSYRTVTPAPPSLPMAAAWLAPELAVVGRNFLDEVVALNPS